jgi:hypothetical protein
MLGGRYEGDPLSPPEREAACGEHPRTSSFVGFFHQTSDDYGNIGGCPNGGSGSTIGKEPPRATACFSLGFQHNVDLIKKISSFILSAIRLCISNNCIDPVLSKQKDALINT